MTRQELQAWITAEVQQKKGCEECVVTGGLYPLAEPDESGCNWSDTVYLNPGNTPARLYKPALSDALKRARSGINITSTQSAGSNSSSLAMQPRQLFTPVFHIDTNRINSRGKLSMMNQLESWALHGVIEIIMSGTSFREASEGDDRLRTKKAQSYVFTLTEPDIDASSALNQEIERILFPDGAQSLNQKNDVKIVYDAAHWKAILVTDEGGSKRQPGGMLGNRSELSRFVRIMSDEEAVAFIRSKVDERDDFNRRVAEATGLSLPEWTGKD
jgi:hypothetical protein